MKKYNKPILDIVEFDNLDVMTMSIQNSESTGQSLDDENSPIVQQTETQFLNSIEASSTHAEVAETPTPTESNPLAETTSEPTPAEEDTPVEEIPNDTGSDSTEELPDDNQVAAESISEDEVEY